MTGAAARLPLPLLTRGTAELLSLAAAAVTAVWISRAVGPAALGLYAVANALVLLAGTVVNAGLQTVGSQRVAADPGRAGEAVTIILLVRLVVAAGVLAVATVVLATVALDPGLLPIARVAILAVIPAALRLDWLFVAQGRIALVSAIRLAGAVAALAAAVGLVGSSVDAGRLGLVVLAGHVVPALLGLAAVAGRAAPWTAGGRPSAGRFAEYLRDARLYLAGDVSIWAYTASDRLILYAFATPAVVGLYDAAYRIIQPFYAIGQVVSDAFFLPLARAREHGTIRAVLGRYLDSLWVVTVPVGPFLVAFGGDVIELLYGPAFSEAATYAAILGWAITFGYLAGAIVIPFAPWQRPRAYARSILAGNVANVALNAALIPIAGAVGASLATVGAKVAVFIAAIGAFREVTTYPVGRRFAAHLLPAAAGLAAALVVRASLGAPWPVAAGSFALGHLAVLALIGTLPAAATRFPARKELTRAP